jgi:hypothetical protein
MQVDMSSQLGYARPTNDPVYLGKWTGNEVSEPVMVYIASPYTKGDNFVNVQRQITTAIELLQHDGIIPFSPLLNSVFVNMQHEFAYDKWLEADFVYLSRCDVLLRLSGESSGADKEVAKARELGKPVFYSIKDLLLWSKGEK